MLTLEQSTDLRLEQAIALKALLRLAENLSQTAAVFEMGQSFGLSPVPILETAPIR